MVSDMKIFLCFSYIGKCKTSDPRAGHFLPLEHHLNKLGRGLLGDATHQIWALGFVVSDKKIFSRFPYKPMYNCGYNLNKLGRGPLSDATYQLSRPLGLVVFDKTIFKSFHLESLFYPL